MTKIHKVRIQKEFCVTFNQTAQDTSLSFAAKGLLWYLQSLPDDWYIQRCHLYEVYQGTQRGNGKEAIDRMMNELIEKEYIVYARHRDERGRWKHQYDVYPVPYSEFQKMFPEPGKPGVVKPPPVKPAPVNPVLLQSNKDTKNLLDKERKRMSPTASAACRLAAFLFSKIQELDPKAKKPNLDAWATDIEKLLRLDGREEEEVAAVVDWVFKDDFWCKNILSGKKLREKFSQLVLSKKKVKMSKEEKEKQEKEEQERIRMENKKWLYDFIREHKPVNLTEYANCVKISTPGGIGSLGYLDENFKKSVAHYARTS